MPDVPPVLVDHRSQFAAAGLELSERFENRDRFGQRNKGTGALPRYAIIIKQVPQVNLAHWIIEASSDHRCPGVARLSKALTGLIYRESCIDRYDPISWHENLTKRAPRNFDCACHDLALSAGEIRVGLDEIHDLVVADVVSMAVRISTCSAYQ